MADARAEVDVGREGVRLRGGNGGPVGPSISPSIPFASHLADRGKIAAVRILGGSRGDGDTKEPIGWVGCENWVGRVKRFSIFYIGFPMERLRGEKSAAVFGLARLVLFCWAWGVRGGRSRINKQQQRK